MELIIPLAVTFFLLALLYFFCIRFRRYPRRMLPFVIYIVRTTRENFVDNYPEDAHNKRYISRLFKGTNPKDRPGNIYVFRGSSRGTINPNRKHEYKVGRTERSIEERIHEQEKANEEKYFIERKVRTRMNYAFENLLHILLTEYSSPRVVKDGGSEWFTVSLKEIDKNISKVTKHLEFVWGCA